MPSNRRQFLASSLGLAVGLVTAGCIGDSPSTDAESPDGSPKGSPDGTDTPAPESAQRTVGGATVAVTDIVARKAVTYQSTMGSGGVVAPEGKQFVVASVSTEAELEMGQFSLDAAGETWGVVGRPTTGGSDAKRYVVFELDSPLATEGPRIVLENGGESAEWSLPDEAAETIAASAPSFELDSLDAPESVQQGEEMTVDLSVTNTSETSGRFLAAVYWPTELIADDDESHLIEQSVDAGTSTTASLTLDTEYTTNEDGPVTLRVEGHVAAEQEITVEGASTPV